MFLNIKRNIFKSMLHTPAPWRFDISVIYPQGFHKSQICYDPPILYIAAIFVKYCYTSGSWLFCLLAYILCLGCSPLGKKIIVKQDHLKHMHMARRLYFKIVFKWKFFFCCALLNNSPPVGSGTPAFRLGSRIDPHHHRGVVKVHWRVPWVGGLFSWVVATFTL